MIYSFISLPFCPDPDPGRAKTCGSVRIRIRNPGLYLSNEQHREEESVGVDHATALIPGPAATEEGDNEDDGSYK